MIPAIHRPTVATINLTAIRENILNYRQYIKENQGKDPEIWPAVKANAYAHGAGEVAKAIENIVGGFCVSNLDEALELREVGISKSVLVLSATPPKYVKIAKEKEISLTALSLEWLLQVIDMTEDLSGLKLHLAIDSGMGRIGIRDAEEANQMIELMNQHSMCFEGAFTHFATADEKDNSKFEAQLQKFDEILQKLQSRPHYIHSTNSSAAIWHSSSVRDIVRLGAASYGINPSNGEIDLPLPLKPALELCSELIQVKEIPAGETIGYGATYKTTEPTFIGTIPIGYADGLSRELQGFHVLVDGKFSEIVGRISMDQTTIKLDRAYPIGKKVTIIGKDGNREITVGDLAGYRQSIGYDVLTQLKDRIWRNYII